MFVSQTTRLPVYRQKSRYSSPLASSNPYGSLVSAGNLNLGIGKGSFDVITDIATTLWRLSPKVANGLSLASMIFSVVTCGGQCLEIIIDKQSKLHEKVGASLFFIGLTSLSLGMYLLINSAPILAITLNTIINSISWLFDIYCYLKSDNALSRQNKQLNSKAVYISSLKQRQRQLADDYQQLIEEITKALNVENSEISGREPLMLALNLFNKEKKASPSLLTALDNKLMAIQANLHEQSIIHREFHCFDKVKSCHQAEVVFNRLSLAISSISFVLFIIGLVTVNPSFILAAAIVVILCDLANLTQNIYNKYQESFPEPQPVFAPSFIPNFFKPKTPPETLSSENNLLKSL